MRILMINFLILTYQLVSAQMNFTLEEAIDYAIEHSNDIKSANLDIEDAEAQIMEIKSIGMPKLNGGVNYQYYYYVPVSPVEDFITPAVYQVLEFEDVAGVEPFVGPPDVFEFRFFQRHNVSANLDASMVLFDGSYLTGLKASKLFRELTKKNVDVKIEDITANVTRAYMNILISTENKAILERNIQNLKNSLREAEVSYENGFIEQLDVDRLRLSLENIQTEYENIDQVIATSKDLLKFQMSYPLSDDISVSEDLETMVDLLSLNDNISTQEIDYSNRAEYGQIEMGYDLNALNVERFKKGYLPSVVARANYNYLLQRDNLFDSDALGWIPQGSVSLGVNIPIYDGNEKKAKIKQAEIELKQINIQKEEFERGVQLQVKSAQQKLNQAVKTLSNRENALEIIQNIYEKTQIKFKEGVGSSIEVTQAEQQLYSAQANYISALYNLLISKTDLDIALGTL